MLTLENLSKTYPNGVRALKDVSLEIPQGMFGLLGPNGAGKSTLMRTLATLQEPDSGRVLWQGRDALAEPREMRKILGYLPQDLGVYPGISAQALLDHLAVLKGIVDARQRREVVRGLLHRTHLDTVRKRKLGTFSGGMLRRFGIAQALLGDPQLLIVDEPTAGLDPEEHRRFLNLLAEIGEQVVVILSTHIVEDVRELCGRMAILADGEVLLQGEPRRAVAELHGRIWSKTVARSEGARSEGARSEGARPEGSALHGTLPVVSTRLRAGRTVLHVYSTEPPGDGFEPVDSDLEDVYFSTLQGVHARAA